jgi:hypothetical protein
MANQCVNCNHATMSHFGGTGQCGVNGCSCETIRPVVNHVHLSKILGGPFDINAERIALNRIRERCHNASKEAGWYSNLDTNQPLERNVPEMLCLIHSEISEALEGYRKNLMDDKLPHRKMIEVELADALIRIADLAGYLNLDLGGAYVEKLLYNETRADHKLENRAQEGGKKF